ncbi:outer membrane protein [Enterovirga aerilata]|uniref:Porin family protein n=1 Tax=Enterovirga aerilata TaxID=2730920 RepID=A0A849I160_9HYPH|nr:outer membrane beta-barrel protein [Enterovirga sp. DB1703]NNM73092.1 porin family protein [Enterovirga sp. DB1703]
MVRFLALAAAGLAGFTTAASAADLPSRAAPAPAPEMLVIPYAWSGFYLGVNAGYGFSDNRHRPVCAPACAPTPALDTDGDGFVGGGQLGYNQQIGRFLGGIETDLQYSDIGRTVGGTAAGAVSYTAAQRLDYLGTLRARVGLVMDRVLVFATGGLAYGDVRSAQTIAFPGAAYAVASTRTEVGFAAGGGVEYGFTPNLTGKAEALYYDLGRRTLAGPATPPAGLVRGARFESAGVVARAGLNYKFNLF